MKFYKNPRIYTVVCSSPMGGSCVIPAKKVVEGEFFSRFTALVEVPEDQVGDGDVVWSATALKLGTKFDKSLISKTMMARHEAKLAKKAPAPVEEKVKEEPKPVVEVPVVEPDPVIEEPTEEPAAKMPDEVQLRKMNKKQLLKVAADFEVEVDNSMTNKVIIGLLLSK